jgi:hypothetical protein
LSVDFRQKSLGLERLNMPIFQMKHPFCISVRFASQKWRKAIFPRSRPMFVKGDFQGFFQHFSLFKTAYILFIVQLKRPSQLC